MPGFDDVRLDKRWRAIFLKPPRNRILVIADSAVGFDMGFGLGRAIETIRTAPTFFARFHVDLARRDEVGGSMQPFAVDATADQTNFVPKYRGLRFDHAADGSRTTNAALQIINDYDQVWLFGFAPGNDGGVDGNIAASPLWADDNEVRALSAWMDTRDGGVFATGDHDYLGASLAMRIPRVGTMRRWTNAEGVPPIDGPDRFDTHRPANAAQAAGSQEISSNAQGDEVPQPLEVRRFPHTRFVKWGVVRSSAPHPILCGGEQLGPIDVFPDHAHEGWVREDAEVPLTGTTLTGSPEYPGAGAARQLPKAIAWANTLADPAPDNDPTGGPVWHNKGPTPARRFPVLGAYNGHPAGVGRVVVDSTWHHWMDLNLDGLALAADGARTRLPTITEVPERQAAELAIRNYDKIQRFFINLAIWLAPPAKQRAMLYTGVWGTVLHPSLREDLSPNTPTVVMGTLVGDVLSRLIGPCLVNDWIRVFPVLREPRLKWPPFPIEDIIRDNVIGQIVKELLPVRERAMLGLNRGEKLEIEAEEIEKLADKGARQGLGAGRTAARQAIDEARHALEDDAARLKSVTWQRVTVDEAKCAE